MKYFFSYSDLFETQTEKYFTFTFKSLKQFSLGEVLGKILILQSSNINLQKEYFHTNWNSSKSDHFKSCLFSLTANIFFETQ